MTAEHIGVLVIAAEVDLRKALRANLEGGGFRVSEACDAADGIETLDDGFCPHIIVTDFTARQLQEFRGRLRFRRGLDAVRIIALADFRAEIEGQMPESDDYLLFKNAVKGLARNAGPIGG